MPKRISALTDEAVLYGFSMIDDAVFITPQQTAKVSGLSVRTLEEMRASQSARANALPFYQVIKEDDKRPSIFYRVGDVRAWLAQRKRFINTTEANDAAAKVQKPDASVRPASNMRKHVCRFASMVDWLAGGDSDDECLFDMATGEPIEFFESMRRSPSEGPFVWLAQHEWLDRQRTAAHRRKADKEADELRRPLRRTVKAGVKRPPP